METRHNKRSYSISETIPLDLVIEILTRLPAKSITRFRCVSKQWESTLGSPNFTKSFSTISSSRPKLLFTCLLDHEAFFFTSPQPQNSSSTLTLTADFHMSSYDYPFDFSRPVHGLVCGLNQWTSLKGKTTVTKPLICNPSTGQSLRLPRVKTRKKNVRTVLGYDSIEKQFKVLCMACSYRGPARYSVEHQVLTLGTAKKMSWRMIKCDIPHDPKAMHRSNGHFVFDGVCINGVLYYLALVQGSDEYPYPDIVCFDIRSEKFKCIRKAQDMKASNSILVNYKGKLAMLSSTDNRISAGIKLWTLEDAENHQWSGYSYVLLPSWKEIATKTTLRFVGMTSIGEIVLSPNTISDSFYLLYYNPETNTYTRVEVQGMEIFKTLKARVFLDHIEDVKLYGKCLAS